MNELDGHAPYPDEGDGGLTRSGYPAGDLAAGVMLLCIFLMLLDN